MKILLIVVWVKPDITYKVATLLKNSYLQSDGQSFLIHLMPEGCLLRDSNKIKIIIRMMPIDLKWFECHM